MMTGDPPELLGVVLLRAYGEILEQAERRLARVLELCEGCDSPKSRCGPVLWCQGRTCCPDCTHGGMGG